MKTAISLPDDLFEAAERLAAALGVSRSELYQRALRCFVREHGQDAVTTALDEVYAKDLQLGRLDPELEQAQSEVLAEDDW